MSQGGGCTGAIGDEGRPRFFSSSFSPPLCSLARLLRLLSPCSRYTTHSRHARQEDRLRPRIDHLALLDSPERPPSPQVPHTLRIRSEPAPHVYDRKRSCDHSRSAAEGARDWGLPNSLVRLRSFRPDAARLTSGGMRLASQHPRHRESRRTKARREGQAQGEQGYRRHRDPRLAQALHR